MHRIAAYPIHRLKASNGTATLIASSCSNGCDVRLDSGMPYIAGPIEEVMTLQQFIGAKQDKNGDVRNKPCIVVTLVCIVTHFAYYTGAKNEMLFKYSVI